MYLGFFYHLFRKDKLNRPGQLPNGIKHFRIWFRFRRDIPILVSKKLTPHSRYRYHTADSEKYEYLGGSETQNENILTLWSVAQAGSNDDKNRGSQISLDCPFKVFTVLFIIFILLGIRKRRVGREQRLVSGTYIYILYKSFSFRGKV